MPTVGAHGFIQRQELHIQERWWVGCKSQSLKNDWLMTMFWCVCISVSDQSPSTKWCNKQEFINQVVEFLNNPFLVTFQNGHSPPCIWVWRTDDHSKKGTPCAPFYGDTWGYTWSKVTNPREVVGWLHVTIFEE